MAFQLKHGKIPGHLVFIFFLLAVGIGIVGYLYYEHQKKIIAKAKQEELSAIADLKSQQIVIWRKERTGDATVIQDNPFIAPRVHQWLQNESASGLKQEILNWMASFPAQYDYKSAFLLDSRGVLRLSVSAEGESTATIAQTLALEAIRTKRVVLSDIHRDDGAQDIHLDLLTPILLPRGSESLVVGVLLLRIDPQKFLFPLIQSWPTSSSTSETLLIRHEGNDVLFLNELRHRKGTTLSLRFPVSQEQLLSALAVRGQEGIVEAFDYRGVPVIAAVRRVPDSPWFIIAKTDKEEMYAPIRGHARIMIIMVIGFIGAAGFMTSLIWKKQQADFYRKQYEAKVEREALIQHFEYLTKFANDIILLVDDKGGILETNEPAIFSYGYTRDEFIQLNIRNLRSPEERPQVDTQMRRVEEQNGLIFETIHQRKDGTTFPVEVSSRVMEIGGKKFYQGIIRDITERKRAEEALRKSEGRLQLQINRMPIALILLSCEFRVLSWNPAAERIFGFTQEEALGRHPYDFIVPKEAEPQTDLIWQRLLEGDTTAHSVNENVTKEGRLVICEWYNTPLKGEDGTIGGVLSMAQDVTEQKQAMEEIRKLNAELEQRVVERTANLEAVNKELEAFSYSVSHDLRAPLRSMDGFSQAVLEDYGGQLDAQGKDYLQRVRAASQHMAQLIDDLLNLSHVTSSQMRRDEIDLTIIAEKIAKEFREKEPGRRVDFVITPGLVVEGDARLLRLMMENLLNNAWKFTGKHPRAKIELGVIRLESERTYFVRDDGAGFDMAYADRLFTPFQRLHGSSEFPGTGIGLATVRRVVHRHGGRVWAEGEVEKGATFYFTLG